MSTTARTDEIDELVSSVRDFVSHKDQQKIPASERLVLSPDQRVSPETAATQAEQKGVPDALHTEASFKHSVLVLKAEKPADRAGLEATIAELEAAVTAQSDEWEPDGGEDFAQHAWAASAFEAPGAMSGTQAFATGAAQAEETPQALPEEPAAQIDDRDAEDDLEAAIAASVAAELDIETLRALVVSTLHEELGGELGERITRNVRKLVRREINRVLASQELELDPD